MNIDLTVKVAREMWADILKNEKMTVFGHLGTHFDIMDKEFSLENIRRTGRVMDVSHTGRRDVEIADIGSSEIKKNEFIMFHTGFLKKIGYGSEEYFKIHPQLSMDLIDFLLSKNVSLIGIDAAGVRRGDEHTKTDQYCADHGVFIIENLDNLDLLLEKTGKSSFEVYTFPINFAGMSGLPCRVIAEIQNNTADLK
jgi:kynurenine formamidase